MTATTSTSTGATPDPADIRDTPAGPGRYPAQPPAPTTLTPAVVVVGAGPAGLRAATELAPRLGGDVLVLDREQEAGGIPRHCAHPGYGLRDLRRVMSGPAYARLLADRANAAGATIRTGAAVTGWSGPGRLAVTSPDGRFEVAATAIVLATGARERPRPARHIPGDRPDGVYTTGQLQNLVHLHHRTVGTRAVVLGSQMVSWSAALTLKEAGCAVELLVTEAERPEAPAVMGLGGRAVFRADVATSSRVTRIIGHGRVSGVEVEDLRTGERRVVACDTVITSGDWIPDHELARLGGIPIDPGTLGPVVDSSLRTNAAGVFAAGNLVHPVDTADVAALDGAHVAGAVLDHLEGVAAPAGGVSIVAGDGLAWISPNVLRRGDRLPARGRLLAWAQRYVAVPRIVVTQDGRVRRSSRLAWPAAPGRVLRIPTSALRDLDPAGGPVEVSLG